MIVTEVEDLVGPTLFDLQVLAAVESSLGIVRSTAQKPAAVALLVGLLGTRRIIARPFQGFDAVDIRLYSEKLANWSLLVDIADLVGGSSLADRTQYAYTDRVPVAAGNQDIARFVGSSVTPNHFVQSELYVVGRPPSLRYEAPSPVQNTGLAHRRLRIVLEVKAVAILFAPKRWLVELFGVQMYLPGVWKHCEKD